MKTGAKVEEELEALEQGQIDPASFPHIDHVRCAFEMLRRYSFAETAVRFGNGLRRLTRKAGKPQVYSETITIGFLALIGERLARRPSDHWPEFIAVNPDLQDKHVLERWYAPEELISEVARKTFVLPRPRP